MEENKSHNFFFDKVTLIITIIKSVTQATNKFKPSSNDYIGWFSNSHNSSSVYDS